MKQLTDKQLYMMHGLQPFRWDEWVYGNKLCKCAQHDWQRKGYVKWFDSTNTETTWYLKMRYIQYTDKFVKEVFNG